MKSLKLLIAVLFFCATAIAQGKPLTKEEQRVQDSIAKSGTGSGGFDDFYNSLFKEKKDSTTNPIPPKKVNNTFNAKLFEEQIIMLTKDPKDCFANARVPKKDNSGIFDYSISYESNVALEGVGKGRVVKYESKAITYYAESSSFLRKNEANAIVDNVFAQLKKSTNLPFTYSYSEPYNVATRRLISFNFINKADINMTLYLDIDMGTSDGSETFWQVVVRITKNCYE